MRIRTARVLLFALTFFSTPLWAKTVVLIHGFQSNGMEWRMNGVTPVLQQYGWRDGGDFILTPQGPYDAVPEMGKAENELYTVTLPSRAPMLFQANLLNVFLQTIYARRQEPLILVGHSSGGVVARAWLVRWASVPVSSLITIAAPHLGSPLADVADKVIGTPMGEFIKALGFDKWGKDSEYFYADLRREEPGRFLYWLNHQPHPAINYISIVRDNQPRPDQYDFFVPIHSQDMNNVFALRGHSAVFQVEGEHFTGPRDGYALANILSHL